MAKKSKTLKVGDKVRWHDPWRDEWDIPEDERVWTIYEVREDMVMIATGEPGDAGYSEAEVPFNELTKVED